MTGETLIFLGLMELDKFSLMNFFKTSKYKISKISAESPDCGCSPGKTGTNPQKSQKLMDGDDSTFFQSIQDILGTGNVPKTGN